ncbi:hypothetical protein [Bacillus sp. FJAT-27445]|uniref:hypothetical protein n=1 Tax=Bacillus sp. FJAT-27445 TaxID=1679166 RepID=UPI00074325A1|nr:hypothetical protein [Bacillus sp. FJAT-27445]
MIKNKKFSGSCIDMFTGVAGILLGLSKKELNIEFSLSNQERRQLECDTLQYYKREIVLLIPPRGTEQTTIILKKMKGRHINKKNLLMSQTVNKIIENEVFPILFQGKEYKYIDTSIKGDSNCFEETLDGHLSVDYIIEEKDTRDEFNGFDKKLVQVRGLRKSGSVTISIEYPNKQPCEFYNLSHLSWFIWAFYNEEKNILTDWVAIENPSKIRELIRCKKIKAEKKVNYKTKQKYYEITLEELERNNLITYRKNWFFNNKPSCIA